VYYGCYPQQAPYAHILEAVIGVELPTLLKGRYPFSSRLPSMLPQCQIATPFSVGPSCHVRHGNPTTLDGRDPPWPTWLMQHRSTSWLLHPAPTPKILPGRESDTKNATITSLAARRTEATSATIHSVDHRHTIHRAPGILHHA
jgi:hypothetical protein